MLVKSINKFYKINKIMIKNTKYYYHNFYKINRENFHFLLKDVMQIKY